MTSTETNLSTRDINVSIVRTEEETAYLRAAEKLERTTFEMEMARARLEALKERQGKS